MKDIKENIVLFSLLLFLFLVTKNYLLYASLCAVCCIWFFRVPGFSFIFLLITCLFTCIPFYSNKMPSLKYGQATKVNQNYSILQNKNEKIIVYTEEPLQIDGQYSIQGEIKEISTSSHFYGFSYDTWLHHQGIYYSIQQEDIQLLKETPSIRHWLQKRIQQISNGKTQSILYKSLLNIKTSEDDWMQENGFSFSGMILVVDWILKYFVSKRNRKKINILLDITLMIIYRFPLLIVENLLFLLISNKYSFPKTTGIVMSIIMILYPSQLLSASFLIPAIYRYSFLFDNQRKMATSFFVLIIQSYLFQSMNLVRNVLYPILQRLNGLLYLSCLFYVFFSISIFQPIVNVIDILYVFGELFTWNGSMFGVGLLLFLILLFLLKRNKYFFLKACVLLCVFQLTGLFHPCMEMTVINVGQGDSILIRAPFNQDNILIDTGKPSAYTSLTNLLDAKGIHTIHTFIITHADDDHSGNQETILEDYNVKQCITSHQDLIQSNKFQLIDLNKIESDDENESSVVNVFNLNGKQVCLMADGTTESEKDILDHYPSLKCDILKLGHHGSKTSSSDKFLDQVQPKLALISAGSYSIYHHPSEETIQKLLKRHIPYFNTKEEGDITILCFSHFNLFITSSFHIGLL